MLYYRIGIFLPLTGISREEVGTKTVPKFHPPSDHVKDLLLDTTVFENSILGIPPRFYSLQWAQDLPVLTLGCLGFLIPQKKCWLL